MDWKDWKESGFPYRGVKDPQYIKDRKALFHTPEYPDHPFNGWWWSRGLRSTPSKKPKGKKKN